VLDTLVAVELRDFLPGVPWVSKPRDSLLTRARLPGGEYGPSGDSAIYFPVVRRYLGGGLTDVKGFFYSPRPPSELVASLDFVTRHRDVHVRPDVSPKAFAKYREIRDRWYLYRTYERD